MSGWILDLFVLVYYLLTIFYHLANIIFNLVLHVSGKVGHKSSVCCLHRRRVCPEEVTASFTLH